MRKEITIRQAACAYEPEAFNTAFGFKGNKLTGTWQTVVALWDGQEMGIGLGVQSVLWSDSSVFAAYGEEKSNEMMLRVTRYAVDLIQGRSFSAPQELLKSVFDRCCQYAKEVTAMETTQTFVLNALVPLDMAAWQLWARKTGEKCFDGVFSGWDRCDRLANIPLITYGVPVDAVRQMAHEGACLLKIKLGCDPDGDGNRDKMLLWDQQRALAIHKAVADIVTPDTESGYVLYYFDANGRYDTKARLRKLTDFMKREGIAQRTVLFEEPFPQDHDVFVGDLGIPFAADESVHNLADVARRIQLGYTALTLKPIAKTLTVTMQMAEAARKAGVSCFCADLTVNPLMVQWNQEFAARLPRLPGMKVGVVETNGSQNYVRWETMKEYIPEGGLFEIPDHYLQLICRQNPGFMR